MVAPCIFVYAEEWEESSEQVDSFIDLSCPDDMSMRCDYSMYESLLDLETTSCIDQCKRSCSVNNPVHYNSSSLMRRNVNFGLNCIVMDFYDQCPEESLEDCEYLSLVGDSLMSRAMQVSWNMFQSIEEMSLVNTDVSSVCHALDQSLENIHVIHTPNLRIHMSF
jgi:hypothetical protein